MEKTSSRTFQGGGFTESNFKIRITRPIQARDPAQMQERLRAVLRHAFDEIMATAEAGSTVQLFCTSDKFLKRCLSTRRMRKEEISFDLFLDELFALLQSDEDVSLEDVEFTVVVASPLRAGTRMGPGVEYDLCRETYVKSKQSIIDPLSKSCRHPSPAWDQMCIPLCLSIFELRRTAVIGGRGVLDATRRGKGVREKAEELVRRAGFGDSKGPFRMDDLPAFQRALGETEFEIAVYTERGQPVYCTGPPGGGATHTISLFFLLLSPRPNAPFHAHLITSITRFMDAKGFCQRCKKTCRSAAAGKHKCTASRCPHCRIAGCSNTEARHPGDCEYAICQKCNFHAFTKACLDAHDAQRKGTASLCSLFVTCEYCLLSVSRGKLDKHREECGSPYHAVCKSRHKTTDYCFMQPIGKGKRKAWVRGGEGSGGEEEDGGDGGAGVSGGQGEKGSGAEGQGEPRGRRGADKSPPLFFADIESSQENGRHEAVLLIISCGSGKKAEKTWIYLGFDCISRFLHDCMRKGSQFAQGIIVFHGLFYDGLLICEEMLKSHTSTKEGNLPRLVTSLLLTPSEWDLFPLQLPTPPLISRFACKNAQAPCRQGHVPILAHQSTLAG